MFTPRLFDLTPQHARIYGIYERIYTAFDTVAAWCFVVGSAMYFEPTLQTEGTWLFLVGSLFFAAKPTVRFLREHHLSRLPLPDDDRETGADA